MYYITLLIASVDIKKEGANFIGKLLENNKTLKNLELCILIAINFIDHNKIGIDGAKYLYETLKDNTTLTDLWISIIIYILI